MKARVRLFEAGLSLMEFNGVILRGKLDWSVVVESAVSL